MWDQKILLLSRPQPNSLPHAVGPVLQVRSLWTQKMEQERGFEPPVE